MWDFIGGLLKGALSFLGKALPFLFAYGKGRSDKENSSLKKQVKSKEKEKKVDEKVNSYSDDTIFKRLWDNYRRGK